MPTIAINWIEYWLRPRVYWNHFFTLVWLTLLGTIFITSIYLHLKLDNDHL